MIEAEIRSEVAAPNFLVVGFYTPDYEHLARKFEANLAKFNVARRLYPVPGSSWKRAILLKPQIVGQAMQDFPGKTIILMDIDCEIFGPIEPILTFKGDISLYIGVKFHQRMDVIPSSRIKVWQPTSAALQLRDTWEQLCREQNPERPEKDDEQVLMQAISMTSPLSIGIIDLAYSARDPKDAPPNTIIIHYSANNKTQMATQPKRFFKHLRRTIIGKLIGKSYFEWKYGGFPASADNLKQ